jgi:4-hydroxy-3-methylbut-2-en-1-yl diphosphate reductase
MEVVIDPRSGFCFGVKNAIELAEKEAISKGNLYCLGEIVHNAEEVNRLRNKGIIFIDRQAYLALKNCSVLIRAHGEPPETYKYALDNNIELIDATCPVVLNLQEKVRNARSLNPSAQIVIYGKKDHPELIGLKGQVDKAIIIESIREIEKVNFSKPVFLFAQTTKDKASYAEIKKEIHTRMMENGLSENDFVVYNSICGQVANRAPWLADFSRTVDAVIFVGGKSSSNSKILFEVCRKNNPDSFFVTSPDELNNISIHGFKKVGITGATSTPSWLIEEVAARIANRILPDATI